MTSTEAIQNNVKQTKKTEKKTQRISIKSFDTMKAIIKNLETEENYNKAHHISNFDDCDFSDFNNPDANGDGIANGNDIAQAIDDDDNIIPATNLNVIMNDDETVIMYADEDYPYDNALTVDTVLGIMQKLVKLGRHGIYVRVQKNRKRQDEIARLQDKMDLY